MYPFYIALFVLDGFIMKGDKCGKVGSATACYLLLRKKACSVDEDLSIK